MTHSLKVDLKTFDTAALSGASTEMSWPSGCGCLSARAVRTFGRKAVLKGANMSNKASISGLSDEEAQEFHHYWMQGAVGFTAVAVLAHILVWAWRPWF